GDSVKAGQLLAKIDPESYVSVVQRGQASLSGSKSQLAMSKAQRESSIAQKEQIQSQLENAQKIFQRNEQLKSEGILSQADFENALATVQNLEANLRSAEANIRSADQSIKSAEFNVESSEANLKELQTNLSRTTIKAPVSGIVSSLSVEQGERVVGTIQMTGTEMMRIANLNTMEVQVDVSENDIIRVNLNDDVDIEVDAYLDKIFKGKVTEIANSASNTGNAMALNTDQVTNFVVKIRMESESYSDLVTKKSQYPFRPGMSAAVDIFTNEVSDVISVPIQAVTAREVENEDDKDKKKEQEFEEIVFVHQADTVAAKVVKTGIQNDEFIEILNGLDIGEEVITGPYAAISNKLKDGSEVNVEDEKKDKEDEDE
ncbi:efflux RND transporter periplasmic adaptor subunit, partial [Saprospiraceae bacterium]|nr:efflux RND transporter periplasmic adaptor subunit [Saprospiraceae bacterium]